MSSSQAITAFVNFPSPYTQTLLVKALVSTLDSISISLVPPSDEDPPRLQWADYDLLSLDVPHANPTTHLISSYIYRKALIRKHQLHLTITEYLAKCDHRGVESILQPLPLPFSIEVDGPGAAGPSRSEEVDYGNRGGIPRGWVVDVQFADELDELLMDDLYELAEGMRRNEALSDGEKQWYILKPGFADRAQGIRIFSTEDELRDIFESFEPPSSDEEDYDEDEEDSIDGDWAGGSGDADVESRDRIEALAGGFDRTARFGDGHAGANGSADEDDSDEDSDHGGTGVVMSQLRHFVIQEYMPRPMLFDIAQDPSDPTFEPTQGNKFHLRAYVLLSGDYQLYLSRTLLALFSADPYSHPTSASARTSEEGGEEVDVEALLRPHLTNTCLQTDAYGAPIREEGLVKLFWELEGMDALLLPSNATASEGVEGKGEVSRQWLDAAFDKVGKVLDEAVRAGVECGSFGLQLMPNAFEIFGVDIMLSFPPPSLSTTPSSPSTTAAGYTEPPEPSEVPELPEPIVTLLEFNASPDFHQSGDRLQGEILSMFQGVVRGVVAPFFGVQARPEAEAEGEAKDTAEEGQATAGEQGDTGERGDKAGREAWAVGQEKWGWRKVGEGQVRGPTA